MFKNTTHTLTNIHPAVIKKNYFQHSATFTGAKSGGEKINHFEANNNFHCNCNCQWEASGHKMTTWGISLTSVIKCINATESIKSNAPFPTFRTYTDTNR